MTLRYRAIRGDGSIVEGQLTASGRPEALRQLESEGLRPIEVTDASAPGAAPRSLWQRSGMGKRVPSRVVEEFTRQLSSLLAAGVPLSRALQILHREASIPSAKDQWKAIHDAVVDGMPLAGAMARFPQTFPSVYVAMVRAGETGGFLSAVLAQIAEFQSRSRDMRGKVTTAMIYPAVLLALAIMVVIFLLIFFIPRFKIVFMDFGAQLPLLTRIIVASSEFLTQYGYIIAGLAVAAGWWMNTWLKTEQGSRAWELFVLRVPKVGPLIAQYAMARFCRMLGTLQQAGVPLISALRVACESLGNQTLANALNDAIERVKKGSGLATGLRDSRAMFPETVLEMISIAEETARLDVELLRIATVTESDLERQLRTTVALVEPLMLFLMAAFIGTIFVGMVIPIFSLQDYIK